MNENRIVRIGTYVLSVVTLAGLLVASAPVWTAVAAEHVPAHGGGTAGAVTARDPNRLWCNEHAAYEDECFICHPELREKGRLWCNEHGRYEDRCWLCHPELRDASRPYCEKHFLYEDECHLCRPELKRPAPSGSGTPGAHDHAARIGAHEASDYGGNHEHSTDEGARAAAGHEAREEAGQDSHDDTAHGGHATHGTADAPDATHAGHAHAAPAAASSAEGSAAQLWCDEHGVAEGECGICHPELATELGHGRGVKIRFASPEAAGKAGIETARPRVEPIATAIDCVAEIVFDANKMAEVAAPAAGVIESVAVDLGARVESGDVLATISSGEIAAAVNEAVLARQTLDRERRLYAQRISAQKEVQAAEAAYRTAHERLRSLGFDDEQIAAKASDAAQRGVLELRAPVAGEVVARSVAPRARVEAGESLFQVADRSTMWAELSIPEPELAAVKVGQHVELALDGEPARTYAGTLVWIAPDVDERTRMGRGRVELANADGALRAHAFARARIATARSDRALVVPRSAIQQVEERPFAFVKLADDLFEARSLRLGASTADRVEVVEGLASDDDVVVARSFLVKSQLQISRLGAGCTH